VGPWTKQTIHIIQLLCSSTMTFCSVCRVVDSRRPSPRPAEHRLRTAPGGHTARDQAIVPSGRFSSCRIHGKRRCADPQRLFARSRSARRCSGCTRPPRPPLRMIVHGATADDRGTGQRQREETAPSSLRVRARQRASARDASARDGKGGNRARTMSAASARCDGRRRVARDQACREAVVRPRPQDRRQGARRARRPSGGPL